MIIQNRSTEIGDVLFIKTDIPLLGIITLTSFIDTTIGETSTRLFNKTFHYSVDGINWTPFVPLNNTNVSLIQVQPNDTFYAEYRYERIGSDSTGDLEFDDITLNGTYLSPPVGPAYLASNFNNYFTLNNPCSITWSVNVLEKLYKRGIIPDFIERNKTGNNNDDRDYIDFWRGVTHYFALFVCLAREFQFFYQDENLLLEYIKQKGLFVCEDIQLIDLLYLMQNFYDEIRQRGTRQIFVPKADDISIVNSKQVDGEYLRMICYNKLDEFISNLNQNKHIGFNVGNSSPLYKGLEDRLNTNKYYIDYVSSITNLFYDLNLTTFSYPYISLHDPSGSLSNSISESRSSSSPIDNNADAIVISSPPKGQVGIGGGDRRIVINPNIDYEIIFYVKSNLPLTTLNFGVNSFDKNNNPIPLERNDTNITSNNFLNNASLNQSNRYYFVRGILFNKNNYKPYSSLKQYNYNTIVYYGGSAYRSKRFVPINGTSINNGIIDSTPGITLSTNPYFWDFWDLISLNELETSCAISTSLGVGNNLVLEDDVVLIDPFINFDAVNVLAKVYLYNIRVQPLSTPYSKGFIQSTNLLEIWNTNNNLNISQQKIEDDSKHFLLPYNTILKEIFIPTEINRQ